MKTLPCRRTWEAEAIGDGRLDRTAGASFERHAVTCESCAEELRSLARLNQVMRDLPEYASQPMDRRRLRIALIQRANQRLIHGHQPRRGRSAFMALCACALVAAVVGARWLSTEPGAKGSVHTPSFEVADVGDARWTTSISGNTAQVRLSAGTTALHVEHLMHEQRFLVELPDGELEVRGTRFQVTVAAQRTTRVEVSEGFVALRLFGREETILTAGQHWELPTPVASSSGLVSAIEPPPFNPQAPAAPAISRTIPRSPIPHASLASAPSTSDASAPAGTLPLVDSYEACIRTFESGDYLDADRLLATFEREHPTDARSEDAAFLRAVCHSRMGDSAGATRLASEYLVRYPHGLRRNEAQRLVEGGKAANP
jgi:TolA-binding protein